MGQSVNRQTLFSIAEGQRFFYVYVRLFTRLELGNSEFKRPWGAKATEIVWEWSEEGDLRAVRALRA